MAVIGHPVVVPTDGEELNAYKTAAEAAATAAAASETAAGNSAGTATAKAAEAAASEQTAREKAIEAAAVISAAAESLAASVSEAAASAQTAGTKAGEAAASADEAEDYAAAAASEAAAAAEQKAAAGAQAAAAAESAAAAATSAQTAAIHEGKPRTAATAADMTDEDLIYVYTGSEYGYTYGHWYYWNGTAWTDGGTYNAVEINTDPTLSVEGAAADAGAVGKLKSAINGALKSNVSLTIGRYLTDGVTPKSNDYAWVRNSVPMEIGEIAYIVLPSGYTATVYRINSSDAKIDNYSASKGFINFDYVTAATAYLNFQVQSTDPTVTDLRPYISTIIAGTKVVKKSDIAAERDCKIVEDNMQSAFSYSGNITSTGEIGTDDAYKSTDFIPYVSGSIGVYNVRNTASAYRAIAYYDADKHYLDGIAEVGDDIIILAADIPSGTKYIRASYSVTLTTNPYITINGNVYDYINLIRDEKPHGDIYNTVSRVYGVEYDRISTTSSACTRIGDATNLRANYMIGEAMAHTWANDFDSIYPWGAIRRCNITANGAVVYDGESGFATDGSNGDVFVEIPKFYSFREVVNDKERVCISGTKHAGFEVEPCFTDASGNEIDYIYVAAYETSNNNESVTTTDPTAPVFPTTQKTLAEFRTAAAAKDMTIFDFATWQALEKLFLIEYADKDASHYFNGIGDIPYYNAIQAKSDLANVNYVYVYDSYIEDLRVGQWVAVASDGTTLANRQVVSIESATSVGSNVTVTGAPFNTERNVTSIYCTAQPVGATDVLTYHTGRGTDNTRSSFRYRWMENIWGNTWKFTDGIRVKDLTYYITEKPTKYADADVTGWTELGYAAPEQRDYPSQNNGFIQAMGFDRKNRLAMMPLTVGTNVNSYGDEFYCYYMQNASGGAIAQGTQFIGVVGGGWDHGSRNGAFASRFWNRDNAASWLIGCRLVVRDNI